MKENKIRKKAWLILIGVVLVVVIGTIVVRGIMIEKENWITAAPSGGETVSLLAGDVYIVASSYTEGITGQYFTKEDSFAPRGVELSWDHKGTAATLYIVKIGRKKDLSDAQSYQTTDLTLNMKGLYCGTNYYYQIEADFPSKTVTSKTFDFVTEALPRTISVEGVSNTRDIGGYVTEEGRYRVRQGMIYRGASLDDLTETGKRKLLYMYGIKTDLDLCGERKKSPLGDNVNFVNVSAPYYAIKGSGSAINTSAYREALVTAIRTFAKEENYPIYMHCAIGRDRTGTLAFLINALLGVKREDLYLDYELSFLSKAGCADFKEDSRPETYVMHSLRSLYDYIDRYKEDGSFSEKTEQFMLDLGVTADEITAIKAIMLDEL